MLTTAERLRYLNTAAATAIAGVLDALYQRGLGHLETWMCSDTGDYGMLEIVFRRSDDATRIRYVRALLAQAVDKDPDTAGLIFAASFEERILTRPVGPSGPDGIAQL